MKGYPFVVVPLYLITAIVKVLLSTYTEKIFILKRFKHVYTAVYRKLSWDTLAQSYPNTVSVTMLLRVYISMYIFLNTDKTLRYKETIISETEEHLTTTSVSRYYMKYVFFYIQKYVIIPV